MKKAHVRRQERGYAMAALLVAMSVMAIVLSTAMPVYQTVARREREAELVFRGEQYARGHHPGPESFSGYAGDVMMDFASISRLNIRTFPPGRGSVYFDVSQRVMKGSVPSLRRRSHFTFVLPS